MPKFLTTLLLASFLPFTAFADLEETRQLLAEGRYPEAVERARVEHQEDLSNLAAHEFWIDLMLSVGGASAVEREYSTWTLEDPNNADAFYLLGRTQLSPEAAKEAYLNALRLDPDHARAHMGMGILAGVKGDLREAAASYQEAVRLDPTLEEAWTGMIRIFLRVKDQAAAFTLTKAALKAIPQSPAVYLLMVQFDPDNALQWLEEGQRKATPDHRLQLQLSKALLTADRPGEAFRHAQTGLSLNRAEGEAYAIIALATERVQGQMSHDAYLDIQKALMLQASAPEKAMALYDHAIALSPKSAVAYTLRSNLKEPEEALRDLEKAYDLSPGNQEVQISLGRRLVDVDPSRALTLLLPAAKERPLHVLIVTDTVRAAVAADRGQEAMAAILQARRLLPSDPGLVLHHAYCLQSIGEHQAAYEEIKTAAEQWGDPMLQLATAEAAVDAKLFSEALAQYQTIAARSEAPESYDEIIADLKRRIAQNP